MPMVPLSSKGIQTANGYVLTGKYHAMQQQGGHKGGMNTPKLHRITYKHSTEWHKKTANHIEITWKF